MSTRRAPTLLLGAALAGAALLAGCGTTPQDRALGGAGVGAGTGAVVGAVTGLSVLEGAALGGVVGSLAGVLTDPDRLNLGRPAWRRGGTASSGADAAAGFGRGTVARVQSGLARLGYDVGPVDGVYGPRTARAIRAYQHAHGLAVDGRPSPTLAAHVEERAG